MAARSSQPDRAESDGRDNEHGDKPERGTPGRAGAYTRDTSVSGELTQPRTARRRAGTDKLSQVTVMVVGAGIAGLACARELIDAGVPARVLERGRVVGGRLASKRFDDRYVDIGAAYLTADDPAFRGRLESWRIAGLAHPWTDTFAVSGAARTTETNGPMRWAAPGGLRSLAEDLARELDVTLEHEVTELPSAEAVVLAMPGPQAQRITSLDIRQAAGRRC